MKEEEYYLAIWANGDDGTGEVSHLSLNIRLNSGSKAHHAHRNQPREVVRILSGDPSRGALSLDMEEPLRTGQKVQVRLKRRPRPDHIALGTHSNQLCSL